jgi:hypothetical protein
MALLRVSALIFLALVSLVAATKVRSFPAPEETTFRLIFACRTLLTAFGLHLMHLIHE